MLACTAAVTGGEERTNRGPSHCSNCSAMQSDRFKPESRTELAGQAAAVRVQRSERAVLAPLYSTVHWWPAFLQLPWQSEWSLQP